MRIKNLLDAWDTVELYLTGILGGLATAFAFYQVVMRYVFKESPEWAEESVMYLVIWGVFIISSKLVREDQHIGADFFIKRMPLRVQKIMSIVTCLLSLFFVCLVIWYGFQIVSAALAMDERSTTRSRFPMWLAYLAIPAGSSLILLSCLYRLYLLWSQFSRGDFPCKHQGEDIKP